MQKNIKYWIWISILSDKVSLSTLHNLYEKYKSPKRIWKLGKKELLNCKVNITEIKEILKFEYRQNIENYIYYMQKNNIKILTLNDEKYPKKLKEIYEPPFVLFAKGDISLLNKNCLAIVGCRLCSSYGREQAQKFSYYLSRKNFVIVSGLARGIDTWSHIGCLKGKGKTIAVLGSGLDVIYPPENKGVFEAIAKSGLVISEYIVGTKPSPKNFPRRNRIISGLSKGVLVIEAKKRSGSLITVDIALEQGREVFALPGNVNSKNSEGTNELIKQGAKIVTNIDDIIEELNWTRGRFSCPSSIDVKQK